MQVYSESLRLFLQRCQQYISQIITEETPYKMRRTRFVIDSYTYPILLGTFEGESKLAYFDSDTSQIGINERLSYLSKERVLKNILRHELAHYFTFIEYGPNLEAHGKEYKKICQDCNWGQEISFAKMDIELENELLEGDLASEKLINRVKKLMSLASSANPNESQLATAKANELMLKHNLNLLNIENNDPRYYAEVVYSSKRRNQKTSCLYAILESFYVAPILLNTRSSAKLEVVGSKSQVEIAKYTAEFLDREFDRLWAETKKENSDLKGLTAKNSFFRGLTEGYLEKINSSQESLSENDKKGLRVIKQGLQKALYGFHASQRKGRSSSQICEKSRALGTQKGRNLQIQKGIKGQRPSESLLLS